MEQLLYDMSFMAGMNQDYYQVNAAWWQIAFFGQLTFLLFSLAFLIAMIVYNRTVEIVIAGTLALIMFISVCVAISQWNSNCDRYREWTDFRSKVELLVFADSNKEDVKQQYHEMIKLRYDIESREPAADFGLLMEAYRRECHRRGVECKVKVEQ